MLHRDVRFLSIHYSHMMWGLSRLLGIHHLIERRNQTAYLKAVHISVVNVSKDCFDKMRQPGDLFH